MINNNNNIIIIMVPVWAYFEGIDDLSFVCDI